MTSGDVQDKLDELASLVENARAMPMSGSCILPRGEVLALLDDLRELLPEEFRHAELLLHNREGVVEEGRREAARVIAEGRDEAARVVQEAHAERDRLIEDSDILREARERAEEIEAGAVEAAAARRRQADDYVDDKLARFEELLERTLGTVGRGRSLLRDGGRAS